MDIYTLEAGRAIRRNGQRFVHIGASAERGEPGWSPCAFDTFARAIPAMIQALRRIKTQAEGRIETTGIFEIASQALALLPKQED